MQWSRQDENVCIGLVVKSPATGKSSRDGSSTNYPTRRRACFLLFDYKIIFVNSEGDFVLVDWFETPILKSMTNLINKHLRNVYWKRKN